MVDKIFKLTLENPGHYEVRFLPNINDLKGNRLHMSFRAGFGGMNWINRHLSYALINDEIKVFVYGDTVMREIKHNPDVKEFIKFWDVTKSGTYLDITSSERQGFVNYDIEVKEDDKYNFDKNRDYITDLLNSIKHINIEDVMYQEMFYFSQFTHTLYDDKEVNMYDMYAKTYPEFVERHKVWLRSKKIKQLIG